MVEVLSCSSLNFARDVRINQSEPHPWVDAIIHGWGSVLYYREHMPPIGFQDVVQAWQAAPVTAIHPLRHVSDDEYWASGVAQAVEAAEWIPEGGTVVDFGCGDGRLSFPLAELGFDVIAVDASPAMLERVWTVAAAEGVHLTTVLSDGIDLSKQGYDWEPVDTVVCRAVLIHHSHEDVARLVQAFAQILKPGGHLVCDWPLGGHYVRQNWTDVTTWKADHRARVAAEAGFTLVSDDGVSVWQREYAH